MGTACCWAHSHSTGPQTLCTTCVCYGTIPTLLTFPGYEVVAWQNPCMNQCHVALVIDSSPSSWHQRNHIPMQEAEYYSWHDFDSQPAPHDYNGDLPNEVRQWLQLDARAHQCH